MKLIKTLMCIFVLTYSLSVCAQKTSETVTEIFFKTFKENPAKAYEDLYRNNKWLKNQKAALDTFNMNMQNDISKLGEYFGYELISEKFFSESYELKSFIVKFERQPVRFNFTLYKPTTQWQIQDFDYDDNYDEELEEASKLYRIKSNL